MTRTSGGHGILRTRSMFIDTILVLCLILISGCGSTLSTNPSRTTAVSSSSTKSSTAGASASKVGGQPPANLPGDVTTHGLHIQSTGFQCTLMGVYRPPLTPTQNLVLATDRLQYSASDIQAMTAAIAGGGTALDASLPQTLAETPGGSGCSINLSITNVGNDPIQINRAGVQLVADSYSNTYTYRLVDSCSFIQGPTVDCPGAFGRGGNDCSIYSLEIPLASLFKVGDIADDVPTGYNDFDGTCMSTAYTPTFRSG